MYLERWLLDYSRIWSVTVFRLTIANRKDQDCVGTATLFRLHDSFSEPAAVPFEILE